MRNRYVAALGSCLVAIAGASLLVLAVLDRHEVLRRAMKQRIQSSPASGVTKAGERARGRAVRDCIGPALALLRS